MAMMRWRTCSRHLDERQRAMFSARVANLKDGQRQVGKFANVPTQAQAAKMLNVSPRSLRDAKTVLSKGGRPLVRAVEDGKIAVGVGAKLAGRPKTVAQSDGFPADPRLARHPVGAASNRRGAETGAGQQGGGGRRRSQRNGVPLTLADKSGRSKIEDPNRHLTTPT
jgi:hypothetical protein